MMSLDQSEVDGLQRIAKDFLNADEDHQNQIVRDYNGSKTEKRIWEFLWDLSVSSSLTYTEDRCVKDLALLTIVGNGSDPRDITIALHRILMCCDGIGMDHNVLLTYFRRAAGIARKLGFMFLAERIDEYPNIWWRSSTYRARIRKD